MDRDEILGKELSNLYAIAKQVNTYFETNRAGFLEQRMRKVLNNYKEFSGGSEKKTAAMLRELKVNPGNTSDSIVKDITENLNDIEKSAHDNAVKELGYTLSLNRLISYHKANYENMEWLMKGTHV